MYRIAIIVEGYPKPSNLYTNAFVHARSKLYMKEGYEVVVFSLSGKNNQYLFEGVHVLECKPGYCENLIIKNNPDILCFHAPASTYSQSLAINLPKKLNIHKIVWIHGQESLFYPFYYPIPPEPRLFLNWVYSSATSFSRLRKIREIFMNSDRRGDYIVFVSNWMKKASENSVKYKINNHKIIPNPVDTSLFHYHNRLEKDDSSPKKAIITHNFNSWKYGIDIAIRAFSLTQSNIELHIYGQGRLESKYNQLIKRKKSRAILHTNYVPHNALPRLYNEHYLFIAPSRTDAQGLAMCEFMATGGPVVASGIGGIPEFIENEKEGFLVRKNDYKSLAKFVDLLVYDKNLYKKMSENARIRAENQFSHNIVVKKELKLIENLIAR